ncbi:MAG: ABC-three component system protein [Candidatus Sedimenticola sp. 6PFRAG7]
MNIDSSLPTFKRVEFREGLNVLLSDRQPEATDKQTRNSAGKTSLVEIIHFLLGSNCDKESLFRCDELIEYTFRADFSFRNELFSIERGGAQPSKIFILNDLQNKDAYPLKTDRESERIYISNVNWRKLLGERLFGLPADPEGTIYEQSYTPSFRSMISYFIRRHNAGGFISPERQAERQLPWDWQENLSYLLDLDWQIPFEFQKVRAREKMLDELKKAAKGGALGDLIGTVAELRSQVTVAEKKAKERREQLADFQVLDSYRDLSDRAARAKTQMQALGRDTVSLHETLNHLEEALAKETPPDPADLEQVYASAGVELPDVALRRLDEVRSFYESVIRNRSLHLDHETAGVRDRIHKNEEKVKELDIERSSILETLESRGALEDFIDLQKELAELETEAANLRERFKAAELLEGKKTQLDIDRSNLKRRLQQDFHERKAILDEAIVLVTDAIAQLYDDRAGRFEIGATDRGPEFKVSIEGDRGGGIASMEIFCLDLALLKINSEKGRGPEFIVHDSHLFDGVDERQVAGALRLGSKATEGKGLQYIVTMNSDIFDRLSLSKNIKPDEVVIPTRLSDETETGGLFGFRFG